MSRPNTRSASGQDSFAETSSRRGTARGTGRGTGRGTARGTGHGTGRGTARRGRGMAQKGTVDSNKNASTPPASTSSTPSSASRFKSKSATPGGLSAQEDNLLKELAAKKKAAAALAAENGKKASRKRAADILANETDEEGDDHHAQSPPSKVRRIGRTGPPPVSGSQDTGMVQSILDANLDSVDESDKEDKEDQEYQEEEEEEEEAEVEAEEDMEAEGEENMEEVEGEHDKFAGEEVEVSEGPCIMTSVPRSKVSKSATLFSMESPRTKRIAISGHKALRLHVATVEGFPSSADRDQLCWDLILESCKQDKLLWKKMKEIQGDDALKAQLIDYASTWKGAAQMRGELIAKARISIPSCFGVGVGSDWTDDNLQEALKWLLDDMRFINGGMDVRTFTCDAQAPLKNPAFRVLLEAQWWGPKGEGRRSGRKENAYTDNLPILALIACAVECVLLGVKRGSSVDFSESYFKSRWESFMELLTQFSNKCPTYLETIWDELKEGLWKGYTVASTEAPTPTFDFSALETAAKVSKQRLSV